MMGTELTEFHRFRNCETKIKPNLIQQNEMVRIARNNFGYDMKSCDKVLLYAMTTNETSMDSTPSFYV